MISLTSEEFSTMYEAVIESGCLSASKRKEKLFLYLLEHKFNNSSQNLTQYIIATDVLDRPKSFSADIDGIVRAEIGRLRKSLKVFSAESKDYIIEIPSGKYELLITRKKPFPIKGFKIGSLKYLPLMAIVLFASAFIYKGVKLQTYAPAEFCQNDNRPSVAIDYKPNTSTTGDYIYNVISATVAQNTHIILKEKLCHDSPVPQYILKVVIKENRATASVSLAIRSFNDSQSLSFTTHDIHINNDDSLDSAFTITAKHVNEIVKPNGLLISNAVNQKWTDTKAKANFNCLIQMYDYYNNQTNEVYLSVHECLEMAAKDDNAPLDIMGGLAASYLEQVRLYRDFTKKDPLKTIAKIFDENTSNVHLSVELMIALLAYEADRPDFSSDRLHEVILLAESTFNTSPTVLITASQYSAIKLGDFETASRLSTQAKLLTKQRDQSVFLVDAINALLQNEISDSSDDCYNVYSEHLVLESLLVRACAIKYSNEYWQRESLGALTRLGYADPYAQIEFLNRRKWNYKVVQEISNLITNYQP